MTPIPVPPGGGTTPSDRLSHPRRAYDDRALAAASALLRTHGEAAEAVVASRIEEWWETGDEGELSAWMQVLWALSELIGADPAPAEPAPAGSPAS